MIAIAPYGEWLLELGGVDWSGVEVMGLLPGLMNSAIFKQLVGIAGLAVSIIAIALLIV